MQQVMPQVRVKEVCLREKMLLLVQKEHSPPSAHELVTSEVHLEPQGTAPFQELESFAVSWH